MRNITTQIKIDAGFYIKMLFIIFFVAFAAGIFSVYVSTPTVTGSIEQMLEDIPNPEQMTTLEQLLLIFSNNATKAFGAMFFGIVFGIIPVIFILFNGYVIGVIAGVFLSTHATIKILATGLLPHGIFEIPAVVFAAAYGIFLGEMFLKYLRNKTRFKPSLKRALSVYFTVVIPLLAVAALVEVFITFPLLKMLAQ